MNATYEQATAPAGRGHPVLWVVIGALGTAVAALIAALVWVQRPAPAPVQAPTVAGVPLAAATPPAPGADGAARTALPPDDGPAPATRPAAKPAEKKATAEKAVAAPRPAPRSEPAPVLAQAPAPVVTAPAPVAAPEPARPVCQTCGTVESVTPVQREVPATGAGAVAGGVLGAVVGNQIGKGSGRTAATVIGAVGGGLLGNTVEKRMRKETVYQIGVRMENGQLRTVERASAVSVGSRVTLDGDTLRAVDGTVVPEVPRAPAPGSLQTGG